MWSRKGCTRMREFLAVGLLLTLACAESPAPRLRNTPTDLRPVADHHQHLLSPAAAELVNRVRPYEGVVDKLLSRVRSRPQPEPVLTADGLITMLDAAGIRRAALLSNAYYFDAPDASAAKNVATVVRTQNDWTAEQASRYPDRLVAFCSINPLSEYAVAEINRCGASGRFKGVKLHFNTSGVDVFNPRHVDALRAVAAAANRNRLALIIHPQRGSERTGEAAAVLLDVLTAAPDVVTQIAHLWGGGAFSDAALTTYAAAVEANHPGTRRLYFDVAQMWIATDAELERSVTLMRRIGMKRILYGSDGPQFGGWPAAEAWRRFHERIPLTEEEFRVVAGNVAPYL